MASRWEGGGVESRQLPALPSRRDLAFLDQLPGRFVVGSTPSIAQITSSPEVPHAGRPQADPHQVSERVRAVVCGNDAALAAVVSKLMRIDALWVEVAFVPAQQEKANPTVGSAGGGRSVVARTWGLETGASAVSLQRAWDFALTAPAVPTALLRDDHGLVVVGAAEICGQADPQGEVLVGEVLVDSQVLYSHDPSRTAPGRTAGMPAARGVRLMPTLDAPGVVAVGLAPTARRWLWRRQRAPRVLKGRALQAGGVDMVVTRDGVAHPRALRSITFYRHVRDGQWVRS